MEVRASAICYNRYCRSTLKKRNWSINIKKESPHADSIHSAGKYPTYVSRRISFF